MAEPGRRGSARGAGGTPATVALTRAGVAHTLHPYEHDAHGPAGWGEEAARALGVDPRRLLKTLVVETGGGLAVAVLPVARQLDLKALAAALGAKRAALADPAAATRATGYVPGGISPLGQRTRLPTVLDASAAGWPSVYVSAGRRGLQVELDPADLARLTGARSAAVTA